MDLNNIKNIIHDIYIVTVIYCMKSAVYIIINNTGI